MLIWAQIGVSVDGVELLPSSQSSTSGPTTTKIESTPINRLIFLIGMRGAGKTYIGRMAAEVLGGEYTDADDVFASRTKMSVSQFVDENGWSAFRQTETDLLKNFVSEKRGNHVIALGGGVVETPEARQLLIQHIESGGNVVHITREMGDIEGYLDSIGSTAARPKWGEGFAEVFKRRAPWFKQCSSHEFFNNLQPLEQQSQEDHHGSMKAECARFFDFISGVSTNRPRLGSDNPTTFLSLTFPDVSLALDQMDDLTEGADAVELRVDLLSSTGVAPTTPSLPPSEYVAKQLSKLRLSTKLPIVYSVRSKDQGGMAPSYNAPGYLDLIQLGLRAGCEYVDLEVCWPTNILDTVAKSKRNSHILASWHDWTGTMGWNEKEMKEKYDLCAKYGDVVKLVGMAKSVSDNYRLGAFVESTTAFSNARPTLAINMGALGQMSRVTNPILTPITHPLLPSRAAPGQLSAKEINTARSLVGLSPSKSFYLFGSPIAASVSPTLHNTGFTTLGLPHVYGKHDTDQVDQTVLDIITNPSFGGASVTIPLKLDIIPYLTQVSADVRLVGAVNTIVPKRLGDKIELHGENTDWQAIHQAATTHLNTTPTDLTDPTGTTSALTEGGLVTLVIGAGGTSRAAIYAMAQLGAKTILLYNRTRANAEQVKASFPPTFNITVIDTLSTLPSSPTIIISAVPGHSLTTDTTDSGIQIDVKVLLAAKHGVAIDMAYKPHKTALLQLAETRPGWKSVSGVEILCLQGFKQFELWTGKRAPEAKIRKAVMEKYFEGI